MIKKIFLMVGLIALSSATTNCLLNQSPMSHNELCEVIEQSVNLIEQAKKRGLSDAEIIEELDSVLAEAACADERPIQGKGANLERLLCFAGGVVTAGVIIAIIIYLKSKKSTQNVSLNIEPVNELEVVDQSLLINQEPNNNVQELVPNNNQLENVQVINEPVLNVPQHDQVNPLHVVQQNIVEQEQIIRPRRRNNNHLIIMEPVRRSTRKRIPPDRLGVWTN